MLKQAVVFLGLTTRSQAYASLYLPEKENIGMLLECILRLVVLHFHLMNDPSMLEMQPYHLSEW